MVSTLPVHDALRNLNLKDLRFQCRAHGINPAGNADALRLRLQEHMEATDDFTLAVDLSAAVPGCDSTPHDEAPAGSYRPPTRGGNAPGASGQMNFGDESMDISTRLGGGKGMVQPTGAYAPPTPDAPPSEARTGKGQLPGCKLSQLAFGDYQLPSSTVPAPAAAPAAVAHPVAPAAPEKAQQEEAEASVKDIIKPLLLKDLRIQLRARGLNPAGNIVELRERLFEDMAATGDLSLVQDPTLVNAHAEDALPTKEHRSQRGCGSSGRTPAGGFSKIILGGDADEMPPQPSAAAHVQAGQPPQGTPRRGESAKGNYITDRPSSRVNEPPGGRCQIQSW